MATLQELKKRLAGIRMTGQMAGAMKTASAAKFARINGELSRFGEYSSVCREMTARFGGALSAVFPPVNPFSPPCFILLGSNRGLCGGYNTGLYEYADRILAETGEYRLIVTGRHAVSRYREAGIVPDGEFILPDTASFDDAEPVLALAKELYFRGEVSRVEILWQRFVNTLNQEPSRHTLLPVSASEMDGEDEGDVLCVPDRETVLRKAADVCLSADFCAHVLEAAAGSQAATLVAMRSAFDNAEQTSATLAADIAHQRQSEVTSGVIETSGGNARQ